MYNYKNLQFDVLKKISGNINIDMLEHGYLFADSSWKHINISSPFNRLYFVLDGEGYVQNILEKIVLVPGKMYLIPLHSTYNYICDHSMEKFYVHFKAEYFFGMDIFGTLSKCITMPFERDVLQELLIKANENSFHNAFILKTYISEMILRLFRGWSQALPAARPCIRNTHINSSAQYEAALKYQGIFKFVKDNCSIKLKQSQISQYAGVPAAVLSKSFKSTFGYTLKSLIDNIVVQAAKEKLLLTDMTIKEIAFDLQFTDEFYFSRFFKKHTGVSPRAYRASNRIP